MTEKKEVLSTAAPPKGNESNIHKGRLTEKKEVMSTVAPPKRKRNKEVMSVAAPPAEKCCFLVGLGLYRFICITFYNHFVNFVISLGDNKRNRLKVSKGIKTINWFLGV